jgi:biotin carboxyl carrier protein
MKPILNSLLAAAVLTLTGSAAYAVPSHNIDVRDLMTVRQYQKTGLSKLSPQQIKAFNSWLAMTAQRYRQAGLSKLSPKERTALTTWLMQYLAHGRASSSARTAPPPPPPSANPAPAKPRPAPAQTTRPQSAADKPAPKQQEEKQQEKTPDKVVSHIVGEFNGWNGNTVFKLANGQVWKQADSAARLDVHMVNPKVTIKSLLIGWGLPGQGHPQMVFVRRIK